MIVRFILPKMSTVQTQEPLSPFRGYAFQPLQDSWHRNLWSPYHVHVIGHDDKSTQIIEPTCSCSVLQGFNYHLSHPGILQPEWAGAGTIEFAILGCEAFPGSGRRQDRPPHVAYVIYMSYMVYTLF